MMPNFRLYTFERDHPIDHFPEQVDRISSLKSLVDEDRPVREYVVEHLGEISRLAKDGHPREVLQKYLTFLPPRLISAAKDGRMVPFFGSGLSMSAGIPNWSSLLDALGIPVDYTSDPHLENDPLTQAELIAHQIGHDPLQQKLRDIMSLASKPTLAHYMLCLLRLPVYLTTNYDTLFEQAWKEVWKKELEIDIVVNDADIDLLQLDKTDRFPHNSRSILIKMHGDAGREEEHLILTRSDYRRHYRTNVRFFQTVKDIVSVYRPRPPFRLVSATAACSEGLSFSGRHGLMAFQHAKDRGSS